VSIDRNKGMDSGNRHCIYDCHMSILLCIPFSYISDILDIVVDEEELRH